MSAAIQALVTLRKRQGIETSLDMAKRLSVSRNTFQLWESGAHEPRLSGAERWARALGIELNTLAVILRNARSGDSAPASARRRAPSSPRHPSRTSRPTAASGGAPSFRGSR